MSRVIENRIVEMQFQNKQFEDAVAQSRQSIQLLEKDLKFLEGVQALKNLDVAIQNVDFSGMQDGIKKLEDRFSALGIISMTILQNITNAFSGKLIDSIRSVGEGITGIFKLIKDKGYARASAIEAAEFKLQGLLATVYDVETEQDKIADKTQRIKDIVNAAVTDTRYGYDEAATFASVLASTYDIREPEALNQIAETLRITVGLASQGNDELSNTARIVGNIAARGRVYTTDLSTIQSYGINTSRYIAEAIMKDDEWIAQSNALLETRTKKRKKYQAITQEDISDLISRGGVTTEIFLKAFESFAENAYKANETMDGVIANIKAALGRIGAAFIQPFIANSGPLVKFLNTIKGIINNIKKGIDQFHIPESVSKLGILFIDKANEFLQTITRVDISKIFRDIGHAFETVNAAFSYEPKQWVEELNTDFDSVFKKLNDTFFANNNRSRHKTIEDLIKEVLWENKVPEASRDFYAEKIFNGDYVSFFNEVNREHIEGQEVLSEAITRWANQNSQSSISYTDALKVAVLEMGGTTRDFKSLGIQLKYLSDDTNAFGMNIGELKNRINELMNINDRSIASYNEYMNDALDRNEEQAKSIVERNKRIQDIFSFDYFSKITDAFKNFGDALSNISNIFWSTFVGESNPFGTFFSDVFDSSITLREIINNVSEGFYNLSEKIKYFFETETGIGIIKGLASTLAFLSNVVDTFIKILGNTFKSFAPVFERILRLFGYVGETISELNGTAEEMDIWAVIIENFAKVTDWVGEALAKVWDFFFDILESRDDLISAFSFEGLAKTFGAFIEICKVFGQYIGTNLPIWIEKASPYLEAFKEIILEIADFLKDKLGVAIEFLSPYFNEFIDWLSDITGGMVDLHDPIQQVNDILEDNSEVLGTVNDVAGTISDTVKTASTFTGAIGGTLLGSPAKLISIRDTLKDIVEPVEKVGKLWKNVSEDNPEEEIEGTTKKLSVFRTVIGAIAKAMIYLKTKMKDGFEYIKDQVSNSDVFGGIIDNIKKKFTDIKNWLSQADFDDIIDKISKIIKIVTGGALGLGATKISFGIGTFIQQLPKMSEKMTASITGCIKAFSPLSAIDNETTRQEAKAKTIENFAKLLLAIGGAVLMIVAATWIISKIPDDKIDKSIAIVAGILGSIALLVTIVGVFTGVLQSKDISQVVTPLPKLGNVFSRGGALWKNLMAFAAIIAAIGVSVLMISAAMFVISKIQPDRFYQSLNAFIAIVIAIGLLVAIIGALAIIMAGSSNTRVTQTKGLINESKGILDEGSKTKNNKTKNSTEWKTLAAFAAIIFVIGHAVTEIISALAIIALLPMNNLDKALDIFIIVVGAIAVLLAIIGLFAILLHRNDRTAAYGDNGKSGVWSTLIGMAAIIFIIGDAVSEIMLAIAVLAHLPMFNIMGALAVFVVAMGAIIILIGVIGAISVALMKSSGINRKGSGSKIVGMLLSMAAIIFVISKAVQTIMLAIVAVALVTTQVGPNAIEAATESFKTIAIMIAVLMGVIAVIAAVAGNSSSGGMVLGALGICVALIAVIALLAFALGEMTKAFAEAGDLSYMTGILIGVVSLIGAIILIGAVIGALAETGVGAAIIVGIAIMGFIIAAVGWLAYALGSMVLNIGKGVDLIADAITKLINVFKNLDKKTVRKITNNIEVFFKGLSEAVISGFLDFADKLQKNKTKIMVALIVIISMVMQAIWTVILAQFKTVLDNLSIILMMLDVWLDENSGHIMSIIESLWTIVFSALKNIWDGLIKFLGGEDGQSGALADLLGLIIGTLKVLFEGGETANGSYEGLIQYTIDMMLLWCEKISKNSEKLANAFAQACISVLNAMASAIENNHEPLFKAIDNLTTAVGDMLVDYFGTDENGENTVTSELIKGFVASMFAKTNWTIVADFNDTLRGFVFDIATKIGHWAWKAFFVGTNPVVQWLMAGIKSQLSGAIDTGSELGNSLLEGLQRVLGIASPAKSFIKVARYCIQGLKKGFENSTSIIKETTGKVGKSMTSPFKNIKTQLQLMFSDFLSDSGLDGFVITPTMDLTQIQEGFGSIQNMMNSTSNMDMSMLSGITDSMNVDLAAEGFDDANNIDTSNLEGIENGTMINFTQNNYSPESLSRIDIYRDTKNMLRNPELRSIFGGSSSRF